MKSKIVTCTNCSGPVLAQTPKGTDYPAVDACPACTPMVPAKRRGHTDMKIIDFVCDETGILVSAQREGGSQVHDVTIEPGDCLELLNGDSGPFFRPPGLWDGIVARIEHWHDGWMVKLYDRGRPESPARLVPVEHLLAAWQGVWLGTDPGLTWNIDRD